MAVTSVTVQTNGWVLAIRGTWGATPGAWDYSGEDRTNGRFMAGGADQFPLDPEGSPKIMVTVTRQGFTRSGGQAVASSGDQQVLVAVKPLRRPYPNQAQLDEVNHGDGTRTIRFALSDLVYAGDTIATVTLAAGWRAGEGSATVAGATNASTRALPVPISRWAQPSFSLLRGTTLAQVDVIVAARHPRAFGGAEHQAIAAMELCATDGTTTKSFWFTGLQTSPQFGDNLRCWGGQIDLTGLTKGPITIHRKVFPWIGAARATSANYGTTAQHYTDTTNLVPAQHDAPLVICYDPAGDLYTDAHVFVDAATGTTTPSAVTVSTTAAGAKAGTRAADISTAVQAIYLANRTLPARNGWAADTARAMDWAVISLGAGVQTWGATAITSGANCNEGRLVIQGDPSDSNPRANCIWRSPSANLSGKQVARFQMKDMTFEAGQQSLGAGMCWLDNVEIYGKPGFEADTVGIWSGSMIGLSEQWANMEFTRVRYWKYGLLLLGGTNYRVVLTRACQSSQQIDAQVHIGHEKIQDPLVPTRRKSMAFGIWSMSANGTTDAMVWGCKAPNWEGRLVSTPVASGSATAADPEIILRLAIVNSWIERVGGNPSERIWGNGESGYNQMQDCIIEGLTAVGNGFNVGYNDGTATAITAASTTVTVVLAAHGLTTGQSVTIAGCTPAAYNGTFTVTVLDANRFTYVAGSAPGTCTAAGTITLPGSVVRQLSRFGNMQVLGNVVRNCVFGRHATKHDQFKTDGTLTGGWEYLYGVGFAGNCHANQTSSTASNFQFAWFGLKAAVDTGYAGYGSNSFLKFVSAKDDFGPDAPTGTGNGDYRPAAGSPMIGRGVTALVDRDQGNRARSGSFSGGALESDVVLPVTLQPAGAGHGQQAAQAGIGVSYAVAATVGRHATVGGSAALGWQGQLPPVGAVHAVGGQGLVVNFEPGIEGALRAEGRVLVVDPELRAVRADAD